MLTRRAALRLAGGALGVGVPALRAFGAPPAGRTPPNRTPPNRTPIDFAVPRGACDSHVHVVEDPALFPMSAARVYTPPPAPASALLELQHDLHIDRVVIVQPSYYGADNGAILEAMKRLGPARARGVAVVDPAASPVSLDVLHAAGIRGVRVNLETAGEVDPALASKRLRDAVTLSKPRGWHIQLYTRLSVIAALADEMAAAPVPIVFDHFGGAQALLGPRQYGFDALLRLVSAGTAYVKISGAYRASDDTPTYADVAPLARALVAANPERILWGSDWPHPDSTRLAGRASTDITPFLPIDDGLLLNQLPLWVPDAAARQRILVENPARLYEF